MRQVAGEPSGMLRGKAAVGAYWAKALALMLVRVGSVTGPEGKVLRAFAHYG